MDTKQQVSQILSHHEGRAQAITARELARVVGDNERSVRLAIRDLIAEGLPIASATMEPQGFFLVLTKQEADEYMGNLRSRLKEIAIRRWDFRRAAVLSISGSVQRRLF
jgi:hypothetical protein